MMVVLITAALLMTFLPRGLKSSVGFICAVNSRDQLNWIYAVLVCICRDSES